MGLQRIKSKGKAEKCRLKLVRVHEIIIVGVEKHYSCKDCLVSINLYL